MLEATFSIFFNKKLVFLWSMNRFALQNQALRAHVFQIWICRSPALVGMRIWNNCSAANCSVWSFFGPPQAEFLGNLEVFLSGKHITEYTQEQLFCVRTSPMSPKISACGGPEPRETCGCYMVIQSTYSRFAIQYHWRFTATKSHSSSGTQEVISIVQNLIYIGEITHLITFLLLLNFH